MCVSVLYVRPTPVGALVLQLHLADGEVQDMVVAGQREPLLFTETLTALHTLAFTQELEAVLEAVWIRTADGGGLSRQGSLAVSDRRRAGFVFWE